MSLQRTLPSHSQLRRDRLAFRQESDDSRSSLPPQITASASGGWTLGGIEIPALASNLGTRQQLQTTLAANGATVETVEHLLSALRGLSIDNVTVEVNHSEVPIMDGSSAPWVYLIQDAGVKTLNTPRKTLQVLRQMQYQMGDKRIALYPSEGFRVSYTITFDHPLLRHQQKTMEIDEQVFVDQVAPRPHVRVPQGSGNAASARARAGRVTRERGGARETGVLNPLRFEMNSSATRFWT
jgi:hypothetical protein